MPSTAIAYTVQSAATSIPFTGSTLSTLASATYVAATSTLDLRTITPAAKLPPEVWLTLAVTPGTVSGNKQALLFVQVSFDNSTFSSGPTSGTTTTDQGDLYLIGTLPLNTNSVAQRKSWPLFAMLGAPVGAINPIVFNDSGAAFSAGTLSYSLIVGDAT